MIQVGQKSKAKYWGKYSVKKVAQLKKPVECHNDEQGVVFFEPTIVQLEWEKPPSDDNNEFWFPYWMIIGGKEKYAQFAPMIGEKALLELLRSAIRQDFFSKGFLRNLNRVITGKLPQSNI